MTTFTADHNGFYRDGELFFPSVQDSDFPLMEWSNTIRVRLPARLKDDLDWSKQRELAQKHSALGKHILWEIDLGLDSYQFDPADSTAFFSFTFGLR